MFNFCICSGGGGGVGGVGGWCGEGALGNTKGKWVM